MHQNSRFICSQISFYDLLYAKTLTKLLSYITKIKMSITFFPKLTQSDKIHFRFSEKISYKKLLLSSYLNFFPLKFGFWLAIIQN